MELDVIKPAELRRIIYIFGLSIYKYPDFFIRLTPRQISAAFSGSTYRRETGERMKPIKSAPASSAARADLMSLMPQILINMPVSC